MSQRDNGNPYFCRTIWEICRCSDDVRLAAIRDCYVKRAEERRAQAGQTWSNNQHGQIGVQPLLGLNDADLFAMFMAVHLYLYIHAEMTADMTVDSTRLGLEPSYREDIQKEIDDRTGVQVSLAAATHGQQFAAMEPTTIDWGEIEGHCRSAVRSLGGPRGLARREDIAARLLDAARAECARG